MPLPPFHLGPGLSVKALAGRHFSFLQFGLTQVLIDLEPLYYMLRQEAPLHRFLHTFIGASVIFVVALLVGKPLCEWWLRRWNGFAGLVSRRVRPTTKISWLAASSGAGFGVYSHILLDSIMHGDIRPFAPFTQANPFLYAITLAELHVWCALAGVFGMMTLFVVWVWRQWTFDD